VHKYISYTVVKFIVPDWGDKVNSGIGLSCRPARLHRLAGRYGNLTPETTITPSQATVLWMKTSRNVCLAYGKT
jgi:hypothetical protein